MRIFTLAIAAFFATSPLVAQSLTVGEAEKTLSNALQAQINAQQKADAWSEEKPAMSQEERDLQMRQKWLEFQVKKYAAYVDRQQQVIQQLRGRKETFTAISMQLEPMLDAALDRLDTESAKGMPFLKQEREMRLASARDALNDYHLPLAEKMRRVMEALRIEAEYGAHFEVTDERITSTQGEVQAKILRLGRLALYAQIPSGRCYSYDTLSQAWMEMNPEYSREVKKALEMAQRRRAVELVTLPLRQARQ